jgi:pimeloyl-ACP methyl ester carboxylesterase
MRRRRRPPFLPREGPVAAAALAAAGLALFVVAVRDGSPGGRILRAAVVVVIFAGAHLIARRAGPGIAGVALTVAGTTAAGVGLGLAPPWITKAGLAVVTVAAVVALAAGMVLLVAGHRLLGRAAGGWWAIPAVLAGAVVTLAVTSSLAIAVAATNPPPTALGEETPADRGLDYEEVEFRAPDGVTLSGWYLPPSNGAAVVLVHGAGSTRSGVLDHAEALAGGGYGVLLFDVRGHGLSGGRAMEFGWYGDRDVGAAVSFLGRRPEVEAIGAVGLSMGGEEVIGAAATDSRIRAVVAEGATNRTVADKAWQSEVYGVRGSIQEVLDHLTFGLADLLTDARPPMSLRDAAALIAPRPMLLIAAGEVADEGHTARRLAEASPAAVEVWEVPGAGHVGALTTDPDGWERTVLGFLDEALG